MPIQLPPPPNEPVGDSYNWREWFYTLWNKTTVAGANSFNSLDFTGSSITSIVTRDHNLLTNIQGGDSTTHWHLSQTEYNTMLSSEVLLWLSM